MVTALECLFVIFLLCAIYVAVPWLVDKLYDKAKDIEQ